MSQGDEEDKSLQSDNVSCHHCVVACLECFYHHSWCIYKPMNVQQPVIGAEQRGLLKSAVHLQWGSFILYAEIIRTDPTFHFTSFLSSDMTGQGERWVNQPIYPLSFLIVFFFLIICDSSNCKLKTSVQRVQCRQDSGNSWQHHLVA